MQATRILFTLAAVGAAAFLAFRGCRGSGPVAPATPPEPPPATATTGDDGQFAWPNHAPAAGGAKSGDPPKRSAPPPVIDEDPAPGTPMKTDAEASLVVPYRTGTKSRYRVSEAQLSRDLDSDAVQWWQFVWNVSTEVLTGDGSGPARVKFQIDSFKFETEAPGLPISFVSDNPAPALLANPEMARTMKPLLAILGMPVEFVIGAGGEITQIQGVTALNRKFLDVVDTFGAKAVTDAIDAPTAESLSEKWGEILFPPIGGGALKAAGTRDASFRSTFLERWANVSKGKLRLTNDDPSQFRVEFKGTPAIEELNRPAMSSSALDVEKMRVVASADSYAAAWRFDRATGRLAWGHLRAEFRVDVSRRAGTNEQGAPAFSARFTKVERRILTELLDK